VKPHHVAVVVADLARAERFYVGVLGLPVLRRWDEGGVPRSIWLGLGDDGSFLAVERAEAADPTRTDQAPGWHCLALTIGRHEREAWRERLRTGGHPVERESSYTLYARDPDGNLVGLSHYPDAAR
jgi:glyoxylase I family protein